jgi:hypothetical protein
MVAGIDRSPAIRSHAVPAGNPGTPIQVAFDVTTAPLACASALLMWLAPMPANGPGAKNGVVSWKAIGNWPGTFQPGSGQVVTITRSVSSSGFRMLAT